MLTAGLRGRHRPRSCLLQYFTLGALAGVPRAVVVHPALVRRATQQFAGGHQPPLHCDTKSR